MTLDVWVSVITLTPKSAETRDAADPCQSLSGGYVPPPQPQPIKRLSDFQVALM